MATKNSRAVLSTNQYHISWYYVIATGLWNRLNVTSSPWELVAQSSEVFSRLRCNSGGVRGFFSTERVFFQVMMVDSVIFHNPVKSQKEKYYWFPLQRKPWKYDHKKCQRWKQIFVESYIMFLRGPQTFARTLTGSRPSRCVIPIIHSSEIDLE